jgi:transposase
MRAFLLEQGMVFAQKPAKLKVAMADMLENVKAETLCLEISLRLTPKSSWKLT